MTKRDIPSPNENMPPGHEHEGTPAKKSRLARRTSIAVAGRVASVKLTNFMCHANLLIEFNTKENNCFYIGGPNGSGKSALFAAINLGLGGRGSDNDRGSTVKSYIKDGTTQAKITITLTNEGLNAYPDYDELISVERTINQTSSTYVMKSIRISPGGTTHESIISRKKTDIDRIVKRFNIHLANPAFWMSQDRSRSFLANFKPSNVYKLYLESTNLDNIRRSYERFATALTDCKNAVSHKAEEISNEARKLKRMQEQRALQEQLETDRALVSAFKWKLLFCKVRDIDDELAINTRKIEVHNELRTKCKQEYIDNRTAREAVEKKAQTLNEEVEVQKEEVEEVQRELDEKKKELLVWEEKVQVAENEGKKKKYELQHTRKAISNAQQEAKVIMEKQGCEQLNKRLAEAEKKHRAIFEEREQMELGGVIDRLKDRLDLASAETKRKEDERYEGKREMSGVQRKLDENIAQIRRAKAVKINAINRYGSAMYEILQEIQKNAAHFEHLPKGPLGQYITLTDSQWEYAVEECMRNYAAQFVCSSQRDAALLRKCFDRLRLPHQDRPTLIVSKFLGRAHSNLQEPSEEFDTIYRKLKFTDPDVQNAIIDKTGCESILLLANKTQAMDIMGSDHPPQNATKAYTLDGSQAYAGGPHQQYRFYAAKRGRAMGVFGNDSEDVDEKKLAQEVQQLKERIQDLMQKDKRLDDEVKSLRYEEQKAKGNVGDHEKKLSTLRQEEIKYDRMIRDIRKEVADAASEERLDNLNDGIEELNSKVPKLEETIEKLKEEILTYRKDMEPLLKERAELERNLNDMNGDIRDFHSKTLKLDRELTKYDEQGDVMKARIDKLKADEAVLYHDEARLKTEKDEAILTIDAEKANVPCPPGEQDPPDLEHFPPTTTALKKLTELERTVERGLLGCDQSITMESVKEFKDKLKLHRHLCRAMDDLIDTLAQVHRIRVNLYPQLKKYTEIKVCDKFKDLLGLRGNLIGGLEFDHEKETLNVNVQGCEEKDPTQRLGDSQVPRDDEYEEMSSEHESDNDDDDEPRRKRAKKNKKKTKKGARDLKGLSGGERSFITAALVMSLWQVMEQPFRMMDEFDVFMDMINRKLTMDLLVEMATQKFPHNQFIFFTPQGIKELTMVDGLQVFEMSKVRD